MIDIETLVSKIDILEYISQYADFMQKGNTYWCSSPLSKSDSDPSFSINIDLQSFYDFSTNQYGDVLDFIQKYNKCSLAKSIDIALQYCGMTEEEIAKYEKLDIVRCIKKYQKSHKKEKFINYKQLTKDYMYRFEFDEDVFKDWVSEGIPIDLIKKYNISYDVLNNSIVIPIYDNNGNIVNISNRTLNPIYKKIKIPKYIYSFSWNDGTIDILWGLSFHKEKIEQTKKIIIVEGIKSVLKLESFGYDNSVAILTSHVNQLQLKELIKTNSMEFIFALDQNVNIRDDENIMLLCRFGQVSYLHDYRNRLQLKDSPCDGGKELFDELYNNRYIIK